MQDKKHIKSLRYDRMWSVVFFSKMIQQVQEGFGVAQTRLRQVEMPSLSDPVRHTVYVVSAFPSSNGWGEPTQPR